MTSESIAQYVFDAVMVCWVGFAAVFAVRKRPPKAQETKRAPAAMVGLALQSAGYFLVWFSQRRSDFHPLVPTSPAAELLLGAVTVLLAVGSVGLVLAAVRTLGKQWAIAARLVEGHNLITTGPYAWVRNPIYTGMFGMLLATGLAMGHWALLLPAILLFAVGTVIRVRNEEKLLRAAFGEEFEAYTRRVPAVLPGIY